MDCRLILYYTFMTITCFCPWFSPPFISKIIHFILITMVLGELCLFNRGMYSKNTAQRCYIDMSWVPGKVSAVSLLNKVDHQKEIRSF